tara:strand:+ start:299 stop:889 length:591 start_codon:yes stop_codon:yes gene_type:complete
MKNIFFKIFLTLLLFSSFYSIGQTTEDYQRGYIKGFQDGYCKAVSQCTAPYVSTSSIPRPSSDELNYQSGYARGNADGSERKAADGSERKAADGIKINTNGERKRISDETISIQYYRRGEEKRKLSNHQGAIEDFTKAIEKNPSYGEVYFYRGLSRMVLGDYEGALEDYTKATQNDQFVPKSAIRYVKRQIKKQNK